MIDAIIPSARTLRLGPLAAVGAATAALWALTATQQSFLPAALVLLACGVMAGTVALALDDPAHALLAASPTTHRRRLLLRLAIVLPAALLSWLLLDAMASVALDRPVDRLDVLPLLGLGLAGVAALVAAHRWNPAASATVGGSVPPLWVTARMYLPDSTDAVSSLWLHRPGVVAVVAGAVVLVITRR